jgi:glycosyltransferase involved in cell wall biosynthesis
MKVFIDCRWFSQPGQGVVTYLSYLHKATDTLLRQRGRALDIEFWYGVEREDDLDLSLMPANAQHLVIGRRSMLWRLLIQPFYLRKNGFDCAHFQYICPLFRLGMDYVVSIHDVLFLEYPEFFDWKYRIPRRWLFRLSSLIASRILTISGQSAAAIERFLWAKKSPTVIPLGAGLGDVQVKQHVPMDALLGKPFLLTVGRIEPRKNFALLAEAFVAANLPKRGATLVVAGSCAPEFSGELDRFRDITGVIWLDRVTDGELAWLYAQARGFVFPSLCEGFGIPVLEAIQSDLPLAVSRTLPLPDVVNATPYSFDPYDITSISDALANLWNTPMTVRNKKELLARYSWPVAAAAYLQLLDSLNRTDSSDATEQEMVQ